MKLCLVTKNMLNTKWNTTDNKYVTFAARFNRSIFKLITSTRNLSWFYIKMKLRIFLRSTKKSTIIKSLVIWLNLLLVSIKTLIQKSPSIPSNTLNRKITPDTKRFLPILRSLFKIPINLNILRTITWLSVKISTVFRNF